MQEQYGVLEPHSLEAEQSVLGAIFLKPDLIHECKLEPSDFYTKDHQMIWAFMKYLVDDLGEPIDLMTVAKTAGEDIVNIGGIGYLSDLQRAVPTVENFSYYEKQVSDLAGTREVMRTLRTRLLEGGLGVDPTEYLSDSLNALERLIGGRKAKSKLRRLGEVVTKHRELVMKRKEVKGLTGSKSCSDQLNKMTGGYQKQDFIVTAARPSMGKTAFVLNEAVSIADDYLQRGVNGAVQINSLEMGDLSIVERVICIIGGLDADKLRTGEMSDEDWIAYAMAEYRLGILPIYINDESGQTVQSIEDDVKALRRKYDDVHVIVDFLQLIDIDGEHRHLEGHAKTSFVSKYLKRIARKHDVPVNAISAVGRGVEQRQDKRPMMSDLRESGSIESDADIVMFLYRDDYYNRESTRKALVELIVAKGRNIGTGTIDMAYVKKTNRFLNLDYSHYEEAKKAEENNKKRGGKKDE